MIEELEELFEVVEPKELHQTLNCIFQGYLMNVDVNCMPGDFKKVGEEVRLLVTWLAESRINNTSTYFNLH